MSNKKRLFSNSLAIIINRLTQSIATFALTAAIAKLIGAEALGQYLLAFSYYFVFVNLVSSGLKTFSTRELANHPEETPTYLTSGSLLQFILSLLGYVGLFITILVLPYSQETKLICYFMGLTIIPFALSNITESIFLAQEKMSLIAFSTAPVYILRTLVMIGALQLGQGILSVVQIYFFSEIIILLIQWILIIRLVQPRWDIQYDFMWQALLKSRTFFAIDGMSIINSRMEILILSFLGNELIMGFYGGISQLFQPFLIISNSIVTAAFPALTKAREQGKGQQKKLVEHLIETLLLISLPFMIGLLFFGKELLVFIYHSSFAEAASALKVNAFVLLLLPFNRSLSYLLVANRLERVNLREVTITTFLGGILGLFLVYQYQLMGAAFMDLSLSIIICSQYVYSVYYNFFSLNLRRIFLRPLLLSLIMGIIFTLLAKFQVNFLVTLITATTTYFLLAGVLVVYSFGGPILLLKKLKYRSKIL